ncbi:MAG: HAD hydrolase family protein [Roseburia sp.]
MKKIAFFDIDGTLTSEIDGSIPVSAIEAIRAARANGNLMFINTGKMLSKCGRTFPFHRI